MQTQSESIQTIAKALVQVQKTMGRAIKDSSNPYYKSKYADLGSVMDACIEQLNENGISVLQPMDVNDKGDPMLVTTLLHESGEWIKSFAILPVKELAPQALGSAVTYMRRYSLAAIVGVVQEDDDANAAQFISEEQLNALELTIGDDKEYKEQLLKHLSLRKIPSLKHIPRGLYEKVLVGATKNWRERQEKLQTQKVAM
jgi:hypothetical protein